MSDSNLLYPDDLFYIYVGSVSISPALPYVQRMRGYASVFSNYTISAGTYIFVISNINGKFGKIKLSKNSIDKHSSILIIFKVLLPPIVHILYHLQLI